MDITEQQRREGIEVCDRLLDCAARLQADFAKLQEAIDAWRREETARTKGAKS